MLTIDKITIQIANKLFSSKNRKFIRIQTRIIYILIILKNN
jgi:hypothetical protein